MKRLSTTAPEGSKTDVQKRRRFIHVLNSPPASTGQECAAYSLFDASSDLEVGFDDDVPWKPELVSEVYDPEFGIKVCTAYEANKPNEALRQQKYGKENAGLFLYGHTPEELKASWRQREERLKREWLEEDTSDEEEEEELGMQGEKHMDNLPKAGFKMFGANRVTDHDIRRQDDERRASELEVDNTSEQPLVRADTMDDTTGGARMSRTPRARSFSLHLPDSADLLSPGTPVYHRSVPDPDLGEKVCKAWEVHEERDAILRPFK